MKKTVQRLENERKFSEILKVDKNKQIGGFLKVVMTARTKAAAQGTKVQVKIWEEVFTVILGTRDRSSMPKFRFFKI